MKLLDVNLLLYAVNVDAPGHERAKSWVEQTLSSTETVAFTWPVLLAFLRISTRRTVFPRPLTAAESIGLVESWLQQPNVVIVHPASRHWAILRDLLNTAGVAGNLTTDAHLAAVAIEHGAVLYSTDHDFGRWPALRWENPLARPD